MGENGSCMLSLAFVATARPTLDAAMVGLEWLRFACRLLLLLAKHTDYVSLSAKEDWRGEVSELQAAIAALPPAKNSDVRNCFLRLVERTSGVEGHSGEDDPAAELTAEQLVASESLWKGGLRLGAALELEP